MSTTSIPSMSTTSTPPYWKYDNSVCHAIWQLVEPDSKRVSEISTRLHVSPFMAQNLARLSLADDEIPHFLSPGFSDIHDPFLMHDMKKAVDRVRDALETGEKIRIVTDYDADGTTSSIILQSTLTLWSKKHHTKPLQLSWHIPDRKQEGYGLTEIAVRKAITDGIELLITADIGVRDIIPISIAKEAGIDVIVLDHHLPKGCGVPEDAYAVLCPLQPNCQYPNKSLAACGISLKFSHAMFAEMNNLEAFLKSLMMLAALGTVADVVSLRDLENRAIVTLGLEGLNHDIRNIGLKALLSVSQINPGHITAEDIGFSIGPRINAAGRLTNALHIIDLLRAPNEVCANALALQLNDLNAIRQAIQTEMVNQALEETKGCEDPFIFVVHPETESWHSGVAGIVAGKIREVLHRPVAVATTQGSTITGSIRSIPGVHAVEALTSVSHYLIKFGGHAAAAGFSFDAKYLSEVHAGLCQNVLEQLGKAYESPQYDVHFMLDTTQLVPETFETLMRLEPCGTLNPKPTICVSHVTFHNIRWLKDVHFQAEIVQNNRFIRVLWFFPPAPLHDILNDSKAKFDVIGSFSREFRNGVERYTMRIQDIRKCE